MKGDLYELALTVPWCVTDEALEAMLSIAARDPLPAEEIARRMHGPKSLTLRHGQRHENSHTMRVRDGVATIVIDGPIYRYADFFTSVSGGVTTEALASDIGTALSDPAISAIMLMIDSPGGEATGINELADTIYAARGQKPIVAYIEGYGASAAYWIASAADMVIIDDTALVGSIGVVMGVPDPAKRVSRTIDFVSTQSPKKRPDPTQDAGRTYLQQQVDDMADVFVAKVARNRNIEPARVLAVEGGMLVGQKAVDAGLADGLGSEEQLLATLARGYPIRQLITQRSETTAQPRKQEAFMTVDQKGFWAGFFGGAKDAGIITDAPVEPASASSTPAPQADPEVTRLRAELAKVKAEQIQRDATAFAAAEVAANRAMPAEQAAITALHTRAAELDAANPRSDGQPSCVALVAAAYAARPAHSLTTPLVNSGLVGVPAAPASSDDELDLARKQGAAYAARQNKKG